MSSRVVSNPEAPTTEVLRNRPLATGILNPVSIAIPPMPIVPGAATPFVAVTAPPELDSNLEAYKAAAQKVSETSVVDGVMGLANKGLFFRSSAAGKVAAVSGAGYLSAVAEATTLINDTFRRADTINASYLTTDYRVAVKKYTAKIHGAVSKYEASAGAFVQAQGIIYDAEVTATKLQKLGLEKAISLEAEYKNDIHKAESQAFVITNQSDKDIELREYVKRSSFLVDKAQQDSTHIHTTFSHSMTNSARSYEATMQVDSDLLNAIDTATERSRAARSASDLRIAGSQATSDSRIASQKTVSRERAAQVDSKNEAEGFAVTAEYAATSTSIDDIFGAKYIKNTDVNAAQIRKITDISASELVNKGAVLDAEQTAVSDKGAAHDAALLASGVSRNSLTDKRIQNIKDGYALINGARVDVGKNEYDAKVIALGIAAKGYETASAVQVTGLANALAKRSSYIQSAISTTLLAEKDALTTETEATKNSIEVMSKVETATAQARADASTTALGLRQGAGEQAAQDMSTAAISMTNEKVKMVSQVLKDKYKSEEDVTDSYNTTKLAVDTSLNSAKSQAEKSLRAADLAGLVTLHDNRVKSLQDYTDAEVGVRERELIATSTARGVINSAQAYATTQHLVAQAYTVAQNMSSHQQVSYISAEVEAKNTATRITSDLYAQWNAAARDYWMARGAQDRLQEIRVYEG